MKIKVDLQVGASPEDHMVGTFKVPHWFVATTLLALFATVGLYGFAAYEQWIWQHPSTATEGTMEIPDSVKPPEKPDVALPFSGSGPLPDLNGGWQYRDAKQRGGSCIASYDGQCWAWDLRLQGSKWQ